MTDEKDKSYEIAIRILGNEILAVVFKSSTTSNKWLMLGFLGAAALLWFLVLHGQLLLDLFSGR